MDGKEDKLVVVLSMGKTTKLLGVANLATGTAEAQYSGILALLREWGVEKKVKAICFDTTSVNTGERNGTCQIV